jgi:hypothetical protein
VPPLIRRLTIPDRPIQVRLPTVPIIAIERQSIVLWLSITRAGDALPNNAPRFPAILDTAYSDSFLMSDRQFFTWAVAPGLIPLPEQLDERTRLWGQSFPRHNADLWLYPNRPASADVHPDRPPIRLEMPGVTFFPARYEPLRAIPVVGMFGLFWNNIRITIDAGAGKVSLSMP